MRIIIDIDDVAAKTYNKFRLEASKIIEGNPKWEMAIEQYYYSAQDILSPEARTLLHSVIEARGFFQNIEPYMENIVQIRKWVGEGHQVIFSSAPASDYTREWATPASCWAEKASWIDRVIPEVGSRNLIITKHKALVSELADIVIDDIPGNFPRNKHTLKVLVNRFWNQEFIEGVTRVTDLTELNLDKIQIFQATVVDV